MNKHGIDTEYPTELLSPVFIRADGKPVKYDSDDGSGSYEGYKHKAVCLTGDDFPPTVTIHNKEALQKGIYNLVVELVPEGKIKTRNHYVRDEKATKEFAQKQANS